MTSQSFSQLNPVHKEIIHILSDYPLLDAVWLTDADGPDRLLVLQSRASFFFPPVILLAKKCIETSLKTKLKTIIT